ncbi:MULTISPECIES: methylenetetrahydrofolate reductase [Caproicibacterium]|uniref:Methylenetetrahydrofolate reductase n=1 Tax=Caproicibacterium lactatifermentans TaxID=2666138 RepID=A0A859DQV7_9FIRM|nr:methylenetetrahydrofolate reductase [Caproicibacterium lactatifermentans]MDD4807932.1 methylenetetrahydrofolate reductase [Oscillospiraceae bacterium]QKN24190.1 methylenetetrahydrofolate reductase [NAD(P)H] [Caproicibacterium lactatifermentans]QKO30741.1 methylenetetrahydrofolate reductase [NAD(P)H] [Caproicibacterium lactatifermentans]
MKIKNLLKPGQVTVSCEIFPPKQGTGLPHAREVVHAIAALQPAFVSVTYGAGGTNCANSIELAAEVEKCGVPALAHLTCVSAEKQEVLAVARRFAANGIENILALRGDLPKDDSFPRDGQYRHACELITDLKEMGNFCIGGACYPEGHVESANKAEDLQYLKEKADAGCDFFTSQMFFDNDLFYNFLYRALAVGIHVPILAGIMPLTSAKQMRRCVELSGTYLPRRFLSLVDRFGSDPATMKQAGIAYATEQIIDLIANGVEHIHIYTMNKPDVAAKILSNLSHVISSHAD